jgi:hypothetical protein
MGKNSGAMASDADGADERGLGSRKTRDARAVDVSKLVEKMCRAGGVHEDREH